MRSPSPQGGGERTEFAREVCASNRTELALAPKRQAKAWALVPIPGLGRGTASSNCDPSLRLAAQEDHEIRALAGLRAWFLVRDDQRRPRRCRLGETLDLWRNLNPIKRGFRIARLLRCRLNLGAFAPARLWLDHVAARTPPVQ